MEKCINDFRTFMNQDNKSADVIASEYIDLVNEEFFYFEKEYLPIDVCIEWIDGMIDYLPFYNEGVFIPSLRLRALNDEQHTNIILNSYPRIMKSIHLK
ncbi:hypothetical protein Q763_12635 [Flavobacterium beibuense F44-8]|uniref:Uncharacterized protein n=1 Tax=Flavobacterium beibuense F44-8 TaxID=1406840 RepID=A0A0A2LKC0_9FLAO|nr:hypothetical protein [Flavobacterium beibuense]KGO79691.1 hypothetical protein Q763_12635 [Flavobacterium beibuense F44-8]